MNRSLLILTLLACASAAPALAQQRTSEVPAVHDAQFAAHTSPAAARGQALDRITALRTLVPASEVSLANQLSAMLRSRTPSVRAEALRDIIFYAVHYGDLVDLTGLVPDLLRVFETDRDPAHRIMASQAVFYLADLDSIHDMVRLAQKDRSPRVREIALLAAASRINTDKARQGRQGPR